jgi:hypothetical protein
MFISEISLVDRAIPNAKIQPICIDTDGVAEVHQLKY